jgi:hypothetical protein
MLHLSAMLFLTNAIHALYQNLWMYALAFIALATTSWVYHGNRDTPNLFPLHFWLDQVAIWVVISIGAYYFVTQLTPTEQLIPTIAFITVGILFGYGSYANCFCFDGDSQVSINSHACLHAISSIGHHAILAGL